MGTYADQANQGMSNFITSTADLGPKIKPQQPIQTPQYSTKGRASVVNQYPNLKNLGAITTRFGESTAYEKFHPGIDVANKMGTALNAFEDGVVSRVETGKVNGQKGFGNRIIIKNEKTGNEWSYGHLGDVYVKPGQQVSKGQNFGTMSNTGSAYSNNGGDGTHLDLRIYNTYKKKYVDPLELIS